MPLPSAPTPALSSHRPIPLLWIKSWGRDWERSWVKSWLLAMLVAVFAVLSLTGCQDTTSVSSSEGRSGSGSGSGKVTDTLTVLAGSEIKDLEPLFADIQQHTGIQLNVEYIGTLEGVDALASRNDIDLAWFSHGQYLSLVNQSQIKAQTPTMLSPVVMGIKASKAQSLGWHDAQGNLKADLTWQDIADASQAGNLKYAMTNPSASNSGFTALMGVTSALAGTSDAPTLEDVAKAKPQLKAFFRGQALTSGSSGWLADAYVDQQDQLDAMINYESVLMQMNASGQLREPLQLIYPKEGIVTADYPLMLINFDKKTQYDALANYLRSAEFQQKLMQATSRRPINTSVTLDPAFYQGLLVELPFPNSQTIIDGLLTDYANELRNPAYALFLLDISGSMRGQGIAQLKSALLALTDTSTDTGDTSTRFSRFADNEMVALQPFDHEVYERREYRIDDSTRSRIRQDIEGLEPRGGTAVFSAVNHAYQTLHQLKPSHEAEQAQNQTPPYYYTVVLMTDGLSGHGIDFANFRRQYEGLPQDIQNIRTFTVLFGDADETQMQQIAELTGGRVFDGRDGNLTRVFREIRGYQ